MRGSTKEGNFYRVLAVLQGNIYCAPRKVNKNAHTALVRPVKEYASTAWSPYITKGMAALESVQRKADIGWSTATTEEQEAFRTAKRASLVIAAREKGFLRPFSIEQDLQQLCRFTLS